MRIAYTLPYIGPIKSFLEKSLLVSEFIYFDIKIKQTIETNERKKPIFMVFITVCIRLLSRRRYRKTKNIIFGKSVERTFSPVYLFFSFLFRYIAIQYILYVPSSCRLIQRRIVTVATNGNELKQVLYYIYYCVIGKS